MAKKLLFFFITILFVHHQAGLSMALEIGGQSALLARSPHSKILVKPVKNGIDYNLKRKTIKKVLERYDSPLADSADAFIETCIKYDLDCYFLPAIAGLESYFGHRLMPDSHNPFGWGRGLIYFDTWAEGIDTVGRGLRVNYIDKGATTIEEIGAIYCEGDTWAGKVRSIMKTFEEEEKNQELYFYNNTVKL